MSATPAPSPSLAESGERKEMWAVRLEGEWGSRVRSGEIGDLRDEGSTAACEWYYIENGPECQVGVRVCFMGHRISGPSWHKGPETGVISGGYGLFYGPYKKWAKFVNDK